MMFNRHTKARVATMKTGDGYVRNRLRFTPAVIKKLTDKDLIEYYDNAIVVAAKSKDQPTTLAQANKRIIALGTEMTRRGLH